MEKGRSAARVQRVQRVVVAAGAAGCVEGGDGKKLRQHRSLDGPLTPVILNAAKNLGAWRI